MPKRHLLGHLLSSTREILDFTESWTSVDSERTGLFPSASRFIPKCGVRCTLGHPRLRGEPNGNNTGSDFFGFGRYGLRVIYPGLAPSDRVVIGGPPVTAGRKVSTKADTIIAGSR